MSRFVWLKFVFATGHLFPHADSHTNHFNEFQPKLSKACLDLGFELALKLPVNLLFLGEGF